MEGTDNNEADLSLTSDLIQTTSDTVGKWVVDGGACK